MKKLASLLTDLRLTDLCPPMSLRVPLPRKTENWTSPKSISLNHLLES